MNKKNLVALSILLALVGCGGGGGGGDSKPSGGNGGGNEGGSGGETIPPTTNLINSWPMSKVIAEFKATNVTPIADSDVCDKGTKPSAETANFIVSAVNGSLDDVINAAKITQVSFNELLAHTKLTPEDLNLSPSDKWTVCVDNINIGTDNNNGTGYPDRFDFAPGTLDITHPDFVETSILTKHELFHTIQAELLNNSQPYEHLPRWFQEGSAELFAGRAMKITSHKHDEFVIDAARTPLSIVTWDDEQALMSNAQIKATYEDHMYNLYHDNLNYLVAKGLSVEDTLTLTRESYGQNFSNAISVVEQKLKLPTPYIELRDDSNSYRANVITTLNQQEISGSYHDDIQMKASEIMIFHKGQLDEPYAKGTVNRSQNQYAMFTSYIADGNYDAYVSVVNAQGNDFVHGPINITVKNGVLGTLDFTGAPLLAD